MMHLLVDEVPDVLERDDLTIEEALANVMEREDYAHEGHWSLFGTWWCDTCGSPYCELA